MRGKDERSGGKNVAFNDRSGCLIGSVLQALARGNQTLRVVRLLGGTGGAVHEAQGRVEQHRNVREVDPGVQGPDSVGFDAVDALQD
jgi:hypothetical protein